MEKFKIILKWSTIFIVGQIAILIIFFFRKEIIDWAEKPADNASVVLIVVFSCYIFSLPLIHKLNKIIDIIEVVFSDDSQSIEEENVIESDYFEDSSHE